MYDPIAVIQHQGAMTRDGEGQGHYVCDVKWTKSKQWFRTNDNEKPFPISQENVSKNCAVVLYKKIN